MEKYFDDPSTITVEEIKATIRKATLAMEVNPMICGSSFKNKGVQTLLDAVRAYLPHLRTQALRPRRRRSRRDRDREPKPDAPMCASPSRSPHRPLRSCPCFFRVYSGEIQSGSYVLNSRSARRRESPAFPMHSNKQNPKEVIGCGDIGAGSRLQGYPHGRHPLRREPSDRA